MNSLHHSQPQDQSSLDQALELPASIADDEVNRSRSNIDVTGFGAHATSSTNKLDLNNPNIAKDAEIRAGRSLHNSSQENQHVILQDEDEDGDELEEEVEDEQEDQDNDPYNASENTSKKKDDEDEEQADDDNVSTSQNNSENQSDHED